MATIQEFRQKYPQYEDMSDQQLADALYKKYYSDMSRQDYDAKIGLSQPQVPMADGGPTPQARQEPLSASEAASRAYRDRVGPRTGIDPENYDTVHKYAGFLTPIVDVAAMAGDALAGGYEALAIGGGQALENIGVPGGRRLGRDIAAMPEAFAGSAASLPSAPVQATIGAKAAKVAKPSPMREMTQAMERANVTPSLTTVSDSEAVRKVSGGLESVPLVGRPIKNRLDKNVQEAQAEAQRLARTQGTPGDAYDAGEALQEGARGYIAESRAEGGRLYDEARRLASPPPRELRSTGVDARSEELMGLLKDRYPGAQLEISKSSNQAGKSNYVEGAIWNGRKYVRVRARVSDHGVGQRRHHIDREFGTEFIDASGPVDLGKYIANLDRAYESIGGKIKGGAAPVTPTGAVAAIDRNLAELNKLPNQNKATIKAFEEIRADLVDEAGNIRPMDIETLRDMRTAMRTKLVAEGLRATDAERRAGQVFDAAKKDIETALSGNPQALAAYRKADKFWADRVERIDTAIAKVLGKQDDLDPEKATARIIEMAGVKGSSNTLADIVNSVPKEARGDLVATVIANMGRKGEGFSPAVFATQWDKMTPRAKNTLFGPELKGAMDNLSRVMKRLGQVDAARPRGSAPVQVTWGGVAAILQGMAAQAAGGGYAASRLMASPRFVRWLANRGSIERKARAGFDVSTDLRQSIQNLGLLAASNDNAATDIARFAEALRADSRAVAEVQDQEGDASQ